MPTVQDFDEKGNAVDDRPFDELRHVYGLEDKG
jgi:hypothetical protein